ncbi:MAG: hypothetical protein K0S56_572 [Microvirga sp.]|nr:hypothetical protein [Microvirga sp.]
MTTDADVCAHVKSRFRGKKTSRQECTTMTRREEIARTFTKGDDVLKVGDDHKTFGITQTPGTGLAAVHTNKIEVYGDEELRDRILAILSLPAVADDRQEIINAILALPPPGDVSGLMKRLRDLDANTANPPYWTTGICGEAASAIVQKNAEIAQVQESLMRVAEAIGSSSATACLWLDVKAAIEKKDTEIARLRKDYAEACESIRWAEENRNFQQARATTADAEIARLREEVRALSDALSEAGDRNDIARRRATTAEQERGPYGYLIGHRELDETSWRIEPDPDDDPEYFCVALYTVDEPRCRTPSATRLVKGS